MPLYIEKKLMVTSTDQPTDQRTDQQQGEYRAICLFRNLENRKKAEICNTTIHFHMFKKSFALPEKVFSKEEIQRFESFAGF